MRNGPVAALFVTGAMALSWATSATAGENDVKVLRSIPYSGDAQVRQAVKDQCALQTKLPQYLGEHSDRVELADGPLGQTGRVLELTITNVRTAGGGAFSGPKWITVVGVLRENGREIGNFTAKRITMSPFKLTACSATDRCAKALGLDIATWLENPQPDSKLGSA